MNDPFRDIAQELRRNLDLYRELLAVIEAESRSLRQPESESLFPLYSAKKNLLPRLDQSLDSLRKHRVLWQKAGVAERARYPEIGSLLRLNQDAIMKILVLDRENEQALLRRGLIPAQALPSVNRQRPHVVADLYRRQGQG